MYQHYFDTSLGDEPITVMLGWDRPLQGYFMLIESTQRDGYIYSNLEDIELVKCGGFASSLDYFIDKMRELGVAVPSRMLAEVGADGESNVGNRYVAYGVGGGALWER